MAIKKIFKGHINSVLDIDYSPTGKEFISGSFDRTVRLWEEKLSHCRDVYHGKRMQKVFSVAWSLDSNYIFTGSEDFKLRVWKAIKNKKVGVMGFKEKLKSEYREKLLKKFKYNDEIKAIRKPHLPKYRS